jgi:hypothetical protein
VAKETCLDIGMVNRAYADGFLGPVLRGLPAVDACLKDVEQFKAKYASPFQWQLEREGLSRDQIYKALRSSKIRPAGRPLDSGGSWHRTRFYKRSDLASLGI